MPMPPIKSSEIVKKVLENFRAECKSVDGKIVVPEVYWIFLHPADYERLKNIENEIVEKLKETLSDELARLNLGIDFFEKGMVSRNVAESLEFYKYVSNIAQETVETARPLNKKYVEPVNGWQISLNPDQNGECSENQVIIKSIGIEFQSKSTDPLLTAKVKRDVTVKHEINGEIETLTNGKSFPANQLTDSASKTYAIINLKTPNGKTPFAMTKNTFSIGRGGDDFWVDLPLGDNPNIDREHIRITRDETNGKFYIKDLSRTGAILNGIKLPSATVETDVQTELPKHSLIVLPGEIILEFESDS
jgi:hypothetical protein